MTSELKVDKITPASGTNTQIGEAGDTTNLSAGTVTLPTSIITGASEKTTLVDADKFLIADSADSNAFKHVQKSNLPSGGLVFIKGGSTTSNVSNVSITNCFNATYRQYLLIFDYTPDSNGENPRIQFQDGSGSNINSSSYGYAFSGQDFSGGSENTVANNNDTAFQPGQGTKNQSNTDYPATSGVLHIINPFSSSHNVNWMGTLLNRGNNGEDRAYAGAGRLNVQTQCTGLTFFFGSGNVNNATIKVYGIVDS